MNEESGISRQPSEYVYVIGSADSSVIKIGRTTDVDRRLADIQRMSPLKLSVLWKTEGAAALELALHRWFSSSRSHGEWFDFGGLDAVELIEEASREIASQGAPQTEPTRKPDSARRSSGGIADPKPARVALASELRRCRERSGLSRRQLAEAIGLGHSKIAQVETGAQRIRVPEAVAWCTATEVDEVLRRLIAEWALLVWTDSPRPVGDAFDDLGGYARFQRLPAKE